MGLISFVKNAGAKLFGRKKKVEAPKQTAVTSQKTAEELEAEHNAQKAVELENLVRGLGLDVSDLYIEVNDDVATVHGSTSSQAEKEKVVLAIGNVTGIASVHDNLSVERGEEAETTSHEIPANYHTVVKGDTLSKIAKHYYGNAMKYPMLFEANKPMLKDPNLIYPGQVLRIPTLA
ncbi:MAG: peptidoglycan-binding protein LysM [Chitinophagales bacterium]